MVEELAIEQQDVTRCCKVLKLSTSGYYDWIKRPESVKKYEDERIYQKIKIHWQKSRKSYGARRITAKLRGEGEQIGRKRVGKIMNRNGIKAIGKRKFKPITTNSNHRLPIAERVFKPEIASTQVTRVNQCWGGDITYIPTEEGWLYLAVFIDLFTRKVVGHTMRETMHAEMVTSALEMSIKRQGIDCGTENLIIHSDRGSQYASEEYRAKLTKYNIIPSMSRKGNCYDNCFVESFFRTLKVELIYNKKWPCCMNHLGEELPLTSI